MIWHERQRELLSDGEWVGLLLSTMLDNVADIREQHKLALDDGSFELSEYDVRCTQIAAPGTRSIAKQLRIKHPRVHDDGKSADWVMTTDQVLVLALPTGQLEFLAIAFKPKGIVTKRSRQLLAIEKAYWEARGVKWLLVTPEVFEESVGLTLRRTAPWGLGTPVPSSSIETAHRVVDLTLGFSFTNTIDTLASVLGDQDTAQRALWQGVWSGAIPIDLRMSWSPHLPIRLISSQTFWDLNPIASRRTAWI